MTRRRVAAVAGGLLVLTAAVAALAQLSGPRGLTATLVPGDRPLVEAVAVTGTGVPTGVSAQGLVAAAAGGPMRVRWDGYLLVPETREYELRVVSDVRVVLWLDGREVFDSAGSFDPPARRRRLTAGQHLLGLEYGPTVRPSVLDVQWDVGNRFRLAPIPLEAISPRSLRDWKWRVGRFLPAAALALCTAWSLALLLVSWAWVWGIAKREVGKDSTLTATLAGLAALFIAGIWWGGIGGWQADAIDPESVRVAVLQGFRGGWHDKYPPLHYYLLGVLYLPTIVADRLQWLTVHSETVQLHMTLTGRLLSVVMAMATVLAVAILAVRTLDRRHAWLAALCAGCFLPFAFYAKSTNVDLPFVCWFAWSLVFLAALYGGAPAKSTAVLLGITAAAAVGTKDQAYGLYVFPVVLLAWRFGRSIEGLKLLAIGALAAIATLAIVYNVFLNPQGLRLHLEFVQGPASTGYRMFEPTAAGHRDLLMSSAGQLLAGLGVAGTLLVLGSLGSPHYTRSQQVCLILAAAALSYYVTFIAYAGYVYDRFLLPVTCILALPAAAGARRLLDARPGIRIIGVLILGWLGARAAATDLLMIRDSRVVAERWLVARVARNEIVAAVNQYGYIPRIYQFKRVWINPAIDYTLAVNPDYVVVNPEFSLRASPDSSEGQWLSWLESGSGQYEEVFRYKASAAWTPLALDYRFRDRIQDPFTNLDKVNPEIVIFRKRK